MIHKPRIRRMDRFTNTGRLRKRESQSAIPPCRVPVMARHARSLPHTTHTPNDQPAATRRPMPLSSTSAPPCKCPYCARLAATPAANTQPPTPAPTCATSRPSPLMSTASLMSPPEHGPANTHSPLIHMPHTCTHLGHHQAVTADVHRLTDVITVHLAAGGRVHQLLRAGMGTGTGTGCWW